MPVHIGRTGEGRGPFLQLTEVSYVALANGVVVGVGAEGILSTEPDQLPHHHIGFLNCQLIEGGSIGPLAVVAIVVHFGLHELGGVVGDGDADVSLIHGVYLPFCPLLGHLKYSRKVYSCKEIYLGV